MLEILQAGLLQVSEEYIKHPNFSIDDYRGMCVQYLLSALLIQLGEQGDCGLYEYSESHGWVGWVTVGDCTLFFAPTSVVILCGDERNRMKTGGDELSPYGSLK
jgi:hypothetical protein